MAEKALVLSGDPWEMADERTGEMRKGVSIWFVNQYRDGENGQKPSKVSAVPEVLEGLRGKMPAVCELEYGARPGAQGKATLTLISARVLRPVDLSSFFAGKSPAVPA